MGKGPGVQQRDYEAETRATLKAQVEMMPEIYAAEAEFRPQFAQLDMDIAKEISPQLVDLYKDIAPGLAEADAKSASFQREADIADIEKLGGRAREAYLEANPLIAELERQAMADLESGGNLSAYDRRRVQQDIRGAQADRGMGYGIQDAAMEAYVQDRAFEGRKMQRQGFATQVAGMSADPFMSILGRSSGSGAANAVGQAQGFNPGKLFNPESQYAADIHAGNAQGVNASRMAGKLMGHQLMVEGIRSASGIIGALGGAAMCWVAREVYGESNPKWLAFRHWMLNHAPAWFRWLYIKTGPYVAVAIRPFPAIKSLIRNWMDERIRNVIF